MANILGIIEFGNPMLWLGGFAVGVPLAIHLLTRRTPRKLVFPTIKFIMSAKASQSSIFKIRHLIMLLIRTALIILLLLVFLRPISSSGLKTADKDDKKGKGAIILLDVSASMGYTGSGVTPLSKAKLAAEKIINSQTGNSRMNLIQVGVTPSSSFDNPTENRFHLRNDLAKATLTQDRGDIDAAVAEAVEQLRQMGKAKKEIYFISDFQRSNWAATKFTAIPKEIDTVFIPVNADDAQNAAITEVNVHPAAPSVGEEIQIVCKAANYSDKRQTIPLELKFHHEKVLKQSVEVEPRMTAQATFRIRTKKSGHYEAQLSIPDDSLMIDNRRYFTLDVAEQINVLLVTDEKPGAGPAGSRFLQQAINPYVDSKSGSVNVTVINSGQLDIFSISKAQEIILSSINELTRKDAELLLQYVRNGGSLIYFHVGGAASHNLRQLVKLSEKDLVLPYDLTGQINLATSDNHTSLGQGNFDDPILLKFKEAVELADIRFYQYFSTKRIEQTGRILLKYNDGNFAMANKSLGLGTVLLCNFSPAPVHSDFARHTLFVPFVHEIIGNLRPHSDRAGQFEVGAPCSTTISSPNLTESVVFKNPLGETVNGQMEPGENEAAVFFPKTEAAGFYRLQSKDDETIGSIAVNVNPLESNLESLNVEQLKELTQISRNDFYAAADNNLADLDKLITAKPIWHYFLICAIVMLGVEQFFTFILKR